MKASELAEIIGGTLFGADRQFIGVAPLESASDLDLAYTTKLPCTTKAGVLIAQQPVEGLTVLVSKDPKLAFIKALEALFPEVHPQGIQQGAFVDPTAKIHPKACIYPGAYIGPNAEIGPNTKVLPNAVVMANTQIGAGCLIGPGAIIGHEGFAVYPTKNGLNKIPQVGIVIIEDGTSIGANTCVDRASLSVTRVGNGTQIDNLVQVGHNCDLGKNVILAAQVGLSGSVRIGDGAVLAGQVGVGDHVNIASGAQLGGQTGVHRDLGPGQWMGSPAISLSKAAKIFASWKQLPDLLKRVSAIERKLGLK